MAGSSAGGGGRHHGPTALNAVANVGNPPPIPANGSPAGEPPRRPPGRQGHSSHVAQAAAGALSSDISRRNPQDDYALLQVSTISLFTIGMGWKRNLEMCFGGNNPHTRYQYF